ncbi:MAG: DUF5698 domain-containing protein [Clostridia bacterium]|jgi:uncharacterized protein YebE (UPF0316 family)|nr:DUF5698 domain-containing protein [Clostridia bacterium]
MLGLVGMKLYIVIFVLKTIEVSIATFRMILSAKGEKIWASIIGFFEIVLWIGLAATVLNGIQEDPGKMIAYSLGFCVGIYLGGILDNKLAVGNVKVNAIVMEEDGKELAAKIREHGFAVTKFKGEGMHHPRYMLVMIIKRRRLNELKKLLTDYQENIVIDYHDTNAATCMHGLVRK